MPILIGTIGRVIQNRSRITNKIIEAGQEFVGKVRETLNSKSPKLVPVETEINTGNRIAYNIPTMQVLAINSIQSNPENPRERIEESMKTALRYFAEVCEQNEGLQGLNGVELYRAYNDMQLQGRH